MISEHTAKSKFNKDGLMTESWPKHVVKIKIYCCILMDYFNNCNFSKHELMPYLMMV